MLNLAAAIACELLVHRLVQGAPVRTGRVSKGQAQEFTEEVSKRRLPTFLLYLGLLSPTEAADLNTVFDLRNAIMHGQQRQPVRRAAAQQAIEVACRLLERVGMDAARPATSQE